MRRSQPQLTTAFISYPVTLSPWMHLGQCGDRGVGGGVGGAELSYLCLFVFVPIHRCDAHKGITEAAQMHNGNS